MSASIGKNMERFAAVMSDRMRRTSNAAVPITVELATVDASLSIIPDSLGCPIPQGDYKINIMLSGSAYTGYSNVNGDSHRHDMPATYRGLKSGDRVLLVWAGNEPVVLAVVM